MTTKSDVANWVTNNTGKYLDFDGAYGTQCFDLINFYVNDLFSKVGVIQAAGGAAKNIPDWLQSHLGWEKFYWSNESDLKYGDIITWNAYPGTTSPEFGHVAIYIGNSQKFETNGGTGSGYGSGDNATIRTLVTGGAYMAVRPPIIDDTDNPSNNTNKKGETTMQCTFTTGDGTIFYFNGYDKIIALNNLDQLTMINDLYLKNNGQAMPHYAWTPQAAWYKRLVEATGAKCVSTDGTPYGMY
ncbi:CHAP domain-containing protein [Lactovum miscens]|uniref:Peptidase C51 domain-containing protein n=1 Tax=Lactovum miscens TaxID=190387 RepID=A0A841C878_9LACT|nr:CHAP domain-containing protein [Lactovum miscens]MBB5887761.1 hypothetical protein [Lactovum miscens]